MNNNINISDSNNINQYPVNLHYLPAQIPTIEPQQNTILRNINGIIHRISSAASFLTNLIYKNIYGFNEYTNPGGVPVTLRDNAQHTTLRDIINGICIRIFAVAESLANLVRKNSQMAANKKIFEAYKEKKTFLDLGGIQLTSLPPQIGRLTNLAELKLSFNDLTSLPPQIGSLTNLVELKAYLNELTSLPSQIGSLTNLTKLYLHCNKLTSLPSQIGSLTNLTVLYLSNNKLTSLPPQIGSLTNLESLNLSYNQLTFLPPQIGSLTNLKWLYLEHNQLTFLPSQLGNLTNLHTFSIHHNPSLCSLPMTVGNCQNITYINLEGTDVDVPGGVATITAERDAILARAQSIRWSAGMITLPTRLVTWKAYGKVDCDFAYLSNTQNFTENQQGAINEWLVRLERCEDFKYKRENLAKIVCKILLSLKESSEFEDAFFGKLEGNLECCDDRASMLLNTIYTDLQLYTEDAGTTDKQKIEQLISLSKTLTLRATLEQMILSYEIKTDTKLSEDVEIYLYHEIKYKKPLGLLTAIDNMHYSELGRAPNVVNENELLTCVEENYMNTLVNQEALEKILVKYSKYVVEKEALVKESVNEQEKVEEKTWETDHEYMTAFQAVKESHEAALKALKKHFVNEILKGCLVQ